MSETLGLKNINMLTKEQFNGIANPATDELYAISGSGFGLPSGRYDDLTLGASGATYTAPANGWVRIAKVSTASGQVVEVGSGVSSSSYSTGASQGLKGFVPVLKGKSFYVTYTAAGATESFRFIYAEGE